jgi:hypothetical protein
MQGLGIGSLAKCRKCSSIYWNCCVHIRFKLLIVANTITQVFAMKMKVAGSFKTSVTIY